MDEQSFAQKSDANVYHRLCKMKEANLKEEKKQVPLMMRVTGNWKPPEGFQQLARMGEIVTGVCRSDMLEQLRSDPEVVSIESAQSEGRYG